MAPRLAQTKKETKKKAEQIAWILHLKHPNERFAWVEHDKKVYYACLRKDFMGPMTPTTQLIQYLFDQFIDYSFLILRKRIYTTDSVTSACLSMVKVAAKRIQGDIQANNHQIRITEEILMVVGPEPIILQSRHQQQILDFNIKTINSLTAAAVLEKICHQIPRGQILHDYNRSIAAVLADRDGNILSWANNNNSKNKTLHAEVFMAQEYWRKYNQKIPAHSVIYTSLKPCRMCADFILQYCEDPTSLKVFYLHDDPGRLAKYTSLEQRGILHFIGC